MAEVVALGEVLIDFAQKSKDVEGYPTMAAHAGGAPANFLVISGTARRYSEKSAWMPSA